MKTKWYHWGRWPENVLSNSLWLVYDTDANKMMGDVITKIRDLDGNYFFLEEELVGLEDFVQKKMEKDYNWFDKFFALADKKTLKVIFFENKENLSGVLSSSVECLSCSKIVELLDYGLQRYVKNKLGKDLSELLRNISFYKMTPLMQYEHDLHSIKTKKEIPTLLKKHAWIGTHGFKGDPLTEEKIKEALKLKQKKTFRKFQEKDKLMMLVTKLSYYRSYLVETVDKVTFSYWKVLDKLAKKHNLKRDDLLYFTFEEVIELEKNGKLPGNYKLRKNKFGIINEIGNMEVVVGDKLERLLKDSFGEQAEIEETKELKGSVAYPGKVTAVVRVMKNARDITKIHKGEILVASETTPDYIMGMKKASAIITDQGGITSHAAIVSRELKIPCIIGTKFATKILKDGDLVEVDANRGIIKILK